MRAPSHWAGILAGGDGTRLQSFTRSLTGDDRPKQFCRILSKETLLGATRARLSPLVEPGRTLYVVTRHHARYYREELRDVPWYALIEQPMGRGTTAAVAYAVSRLAAIDRHAILALFPADHHFEHPSVLRQYVATAYGAAAVDTERVFLIGAQPDRPEPEYGYIRPTGPLPHLRQGAAPGGPICGVRTFIEKPAAAEAARLVRYGCVWNTFVVVASVGAFAELFEAAMPDVLPRFADLTRSADHFEEADLAHRLYTTLPSSDFSRDVLSRCPDRLGVLSLPPGNWTDLGQAGRVMAVMNSRPEALRAELEHVRIQPRAVAAS